MATYRSLTFISLILTALLVVTVFGRHTGDSSAPDSSEEVKQTPARTKGNRNSDANQTDENVNDVSPDADPQQNCAVRGKICRSFGPKPLPCCPGSKCITTYGEQHCLDPHTKIQ